MKLRDPALAITKLQRGMFRPGWVSLQSKSQKRNAIKPMIALCLLVAALTFDWQNIGANVVHCEFGQTNSKPASLPARLSATRQPKQPIPSVKFKPSSQRHLRTKLTPACVYKTV